MSLLYAASETWIDTNDEKDRSPWNLQKVIIWIFLPYKYYDSVIGELPL